MKSKASVTVFTAMIFLLIAAVITTSIQSVRVQAAKVMVATSLSLAMDSTLARYNRALFDEWGVLLLDGSAGTGAVNEEALAKEVTGYLEGNLNVTDGLLFSGGRDLYGIDIQGINWNSVLKATDDGGYYWMESVVEYERYEKVINLIASFMDIETAKESTFEWTEAGVKVYQCAESVKTMNEQAKKLIQYIDGVVIPQNGELYPSRLKYSEDSIKGFLPGQEKTNLGITNDAIAEQVYLTIVQNSSDPLVYSKNAKDAMKTGKRTIAKENLRLLKSLVKRSLECMNILLDGFDDITEEGNSLAQISSELGQLFQDHQDSFGTEFTEEITESIAEFENYTEIMAEQILDVENARYVVMKNRDVLEKIIQKIDAFSGADDVDATKLVAEIYGLVSQYSCASIQIHYENILSNPSLNFKWLQTLASLGEEGVLEIALPEDREISTRKFGLEDRAGSVVKLDQTLTLSDEASEEWVWKRVVYDEYVMDHFQNFLDESNGANLNYEVEYVLFGETEDRKNLADTVNSICGIRLLACLGYIMTDSDRKSIAEEYATSIMEWTENEALIKVMKYFIIYLWAEREAESDCKILLSGGKVPTVKKDENWQTDIDAIVTLQVNPDVETNESGFQYRDYLRALLLVEQDAQRSAYTMDLVEGWMEATGHEGFRFKNYVYGLSGEALFTVRGGLYSYTYAGGMSY